MTGRTWIFIAAAIVMVAALFYFSGIRKSTEGSAPPAPEQNQTADIVSDINEGKIPPMEGIKILLSIVEKDSDDVNANYQLGVLSIQSGQYTKAVKRLKKVRSLNADYIFALYLLGVAYMNLGEKELAVDRFNEYIKQTNDEESIGLAKKYIKKIRAL